MKPRALFIGGRRFNVYIDPTLGERPGEGEATHGHDGESCWEDGTLHISRTDDSTLAHEVGHILARSRGVYLSEYQIQVFEEMFTVLRDPRNRWLVRYFEGD